MNHSASLSTISGSVRVRSDNRHHSRLHSADVQYDLSPVRNFHSPTRKFSNSFSVSSALDSIHELDQPQFGQFPSRNNNFGGSMATVPTGLDNVCQKKPKYRPKNLDSITKPICGESFDRYDTPKIRGDPDPNFVDFYIPGNPHKGGQMRSRKSASVNFNFSNLDKSLIGPTVTPSVAATVRTAAKTLLERRLSERANMQLPQSAGWHRSTSNFFKFPDRLDDLNYLELDRSDGSSNVSTPRSPMPKTPGFRPVTPGLPGVSVNYTDVDIVATIAAQKAGVQMLDRIF